MSGETAFDELLARVRQGDDQAASELFQRYEPYIRRTIRFRLTDPKLRRQLDSVDIVQSVMGDFFIRAALGQFELKGPEDLLKLLATMARNKVSYHARKHRTARRDLGRVEGTPADELPVAAEQTTPSQIVAHRDLIAAFRDRLKPDERYLSDQRALGRSWQEISDELGEPADTLRKRLNRAVARVSSELGLDNSIDDE